MSKKITSVENQIEYLKAIRIAGLVLAIMITSTVVTVGFLTIIDWFI